MTFSTIVVIDMWQIIKLDRYIFVKAIFLFIRLHEHKMYLITNFLIIILKPTSEMPKQVHRPRNE